MIKIEYKYFSISIFILFVFLNIPTSVSSWYNGGFSEDPNNPEFGTHDWIAYHALDWLPDNEKQYILDNLNSYLYGTELPDNGGVEDGIGDRSTHHVYYNKNGDLTDDSSAIRAKTEYENAKASLEHGNYVKASKNAGIMSHYMVDVGAYGHVMGKYTDWGSEEHHNDYENYITNRMTGYTSSDFDGYLVFDGSLEIISAYDAVIEIANYTTFGDGDKLKNCTWMDDNYDWGNTAFIDSCGASLNYSVNYLADVLHTLAEESGYKGEGGQYNITPKVVFTEVFYDPVGSDELKEYVELYNPTEIEINLINWKIEDNSFQYNISGPATIQPYTFFTISRNGTEFLSDYGFSPDKGDLTLSLGDNGDHLRLLNEVGNEIDFVAWEGETPGWSIFTYEGNHTLKRPNPNLDTDNSSDWLSNQPLDPKTQASGLFPPPENQSPFVWLTASKTIVNISEQITFNASLSYDPEGDAMLYYWDFNASDGVGDDLMGINISHQYSVVGQYVVTLTVVDINGAWAYRTITINVQEPNLPPEAVTLSQPKEVTSNSIKIEWTQNSDNDFHRYEIRLENETDELIIRVTYLEQQDHTLYNITGLSPNTTYEIMIMVYDTEGLFNQSNTITLRTLEGPIQPENGDGKEDGDKKASGDSIWVYWLALFLIIIVATITLIYALKMRKE